MSERIRIIVNGHEHSVPREMVVPHVLTMICKGQGLDPSQWWLQRESDQTDLGETTSIGDRVGDGERLNLVPRGAQEMFKDGDPIEVKVGTQWIAAKFGYLAEDEPPRHIDHPGINEGRGYDVAKYWVVYQEGERDGTPGRHILSEIRHPGAQDD
jgi:hypothetical protein